MNLMSARPANVPIEPCAAARLSKRAWRRRLQLEARHRAPVSWFSVIGSKVPVHQLVERMCQIAALMGNSLDLEGGQQLGLSLQPLLAVSRHPRACHSGSIAIMLARR